MHTIMDKINNWITINEAEKLSSDYIDEIQSNLDLTKKARLIDKRYSFKEIFREYIPFINFSKAYCKDENIQIKHTGIQTQTSDLKYDGKIKLANGKIITVEIANPVNGKQLEIDALAENEYGYSEILICDCSEKIGLQ